MQNLSKSRDNYRTKDSSEDVHKNEKYSEHQENSGGKFLFHAKNTAENKLSKKIFREKK